MVTTGGPATNQAAGHGPTAGPGSGAAQVAGHVRGGRLRSIRLRLLLPIAVATAGLVVLGVVQTQFAVGTALDARRAQAMAGTATATVQLGHQVEQEIAEVDGLRARGGDSGAPLVDAAMAQTDRLVVRYRAAAAAARTAAPALAPVLDAAEQQLRLLGAVREEIRYLRPGQLSGDRYAGLTGSLIAVADALPSQLTDAGLAATARAVGAIAAAEHLGAQQRDLLSQVFRRGSLVPGDLADLAQLTGAQDERLAEFTRGATPRQLDLYKQATASADAVAAQNLRAAVLAPKADPAAVRVDPDVWYIAQSNTLLRLNLIQLNLSETLDAAARGRQVGAQFSAVLTGTSTGMLVLLAFSAAVVFGVRTSRRLRILRRAALAIAHTELPGAISALSSAPEPAAVRTALYRSVVHADQLTVAGTDEIGEVGHALGAVHRQALRLAADQALLRLDVAGLFVALSRRGQSLIHRQLQLIDEFERSETDRDRLGRLYALDHLAARMRRNEENLLVLAGGEPGRRVTAPVALHEVIEQAAAETEHPDRIDAFDVAEVGIAAHTVRDVVHLLAELLENAIEYSPPTSRVQVSARRTLDRLSLTVFDEGIGMAAEQVTLLNERLRRPSMLTAELAGTMGLLVVARLATRHGIEVELRSALGNGTAALAALPETVLTIPPVRPEPPVRAVLATPAPVSPPPAPVSPAPARVSPAPAPAPAAVPSSNGHSRGLPRRRPGDLLLSGSAADDGDLRTAADPNLPPDPEIVRARLSGLASGLAEAARHTRAAAEH